MPAKPCWATAALPTLKSLSSKNNILLTKYQTNGLQNEGLFLFLGFCLPANHLARLFTSNQCPKAMLTLFPFASSIQNSSPTPPFF